ncbi:ionotropic receptor 75a-like [Prorops nasuta]|uniref:ionotropic receptor 75a-like n=1 Tax=Prorops nasuta TaxID=863751 RepID=UPI0034CF94A5
MFGLFLLLTSVALVESRFNDFISDYFIHKNVRYVVGFSCNDHPGNFRLTRSLGESGMFASVKQLDDDIDIRRFFDKGHWTLGIFVDSRCGSERATEILSIASEYRMYDYLYNWLIFGDTLNGTLSLLNDSSYSTITDLVVSVPNDSGLEMYEIFNHCKYRGGSLNISKLGSWDPLHGLEITSRKSLIERRSNLQGMTLKISGVIQYRPQHMKLEDYMKDINTRSLDSMNKFAYAIIVHIGELFNFNVLASEIIFWDIHSLHGAIFDVLKENYIDIGSNPRVMVAERLDYARLASAAWPVKPCFILLSQPTQKIKLEIFIKPFSIDVWYTYGFISFLTIIVIVFTVTNKYIRENFEKISTALLFTVGIICQQGVAYFPRDLAGRFVVVHMALISWTIYNYYSGSIVSARLSSPPDVMDDSVAVLADSNLKIAAEAVPYLTYLLNKYNWESDYFRKKRWDPLPDSERYLSVEEGIRQVSQGTLAYHTDPNTAYPYVQKIFTSSQVCRMIEIHLFKQSMMGIYVSHNGQFMEITKIGLARMFSSGLRDRQIKYWTSKKPQCDETILAERGIAIFEAAPAFILLVSGFLFSALIFLLEQIVHRRNVLKKPGEFTVEANFSGINSRKLSENSAEAIETHI